MTLSSRIELQGKFFEGEPAKIIRANIKRFMGELAWEGSQTAQRGLRGGSGNRALVSGLGDRVADHVVGRTMARASKGGRRWLAAGVVQVYNEGLSPAEATSLMAAAGYVESRLHVFRDVTRQIARRAREIDLTAGLE